MDALVPEFIRKLFPEVDFDNTDQDEDFTPECEEDVNEVLRKPEPVGGVRQR